MPALPFPQHNVGSYSQLPFFLWQQSIALHKLQADWYVSNFFLPPLLSCKGVVVVHDLSFRAHPEYYPRFVAWYMRWLTGLAIHQADAVCTVSEFSRQELYRYYPSYQGEVYIVPNGVSSRFHSHEDQPNDLSTLSRYGIKPPYIFTLGNIHPRKNLMRVLEAYLLLKQEGRNLPPMVWGGLPRWESHALIQEAESTDVVFTGFIEEADLPAFYRQATMLVYPSLYEGFGPAIVSNTTSLPEAVGEGALTVDSTDSNAIAAAMIRLLDDDISCQQFIKKGFARVQELTWSNTAQCLLAAIQDVEKSL